MTDRTPAPDSPLWKDRWPDFISHVESRLEAGHRTYGDWSFDKPHTLLFADLAEELLDIVGWGYILYCRLTSLAKTVDDLLAEAASRLERETRGD